MQSSLLAVQTRDDRPAAMLIFALTLAAPVPLTETHQRDISCVVEIAVLAEEQRRGDLSGGAVQMTGRRWAGIVGDRITAETGQPRELVAIAMTETAKARASRPDDAAALAACTQQMARELAIADAADAPLPKPVKQ
jgi:hypothetical protein